MTKEEKISRLKFLKTMGFGGSALMALLASCNRMPDNSIPSLVLDKNGNSISAPGATASSTGSTGGTTGGNSGSTGSTGSSTLPVGTVTTAELAKITSPIATIDLTASNTTNLKTVGGYVILNNQIVIGRSSSGNYVAATTLCSHEPRRNVILNSNGNDFYCTRHGARFSFSGTGLNSTGRNGLTVYRTANDGKTLVIY
jgi:nitrite reductase/ring-hydroxylating ferredoxin subunit